MIGSLYSLDENRALPQFPAKLKLDSPLVNKDPNPPPINDDVILGSGGTVSPLMPATLQAGEGGGRPGALNVSDQADDPPKHSKWLKRSMTGLFIGLTMVGATGCGTTYFAARPMNDNNRVERVLPENQGTPGETGLTAPATTQFDIDFEIARLKQNGQIARHLYETIVSSPQEGPHTTTGIKPLTVGKLPGNVIAIQVPVKEGQRKDGPDLAPALLNDRARETFSLLSVLRARYFQEIPLREAEPAILVFGGDHSIAAGTLPAYKTLFPDASAIWFDSHGDINTWETSPSKNPHGMPVAVAVGRQDEPLRDAYGFVTPDVQQTNVSYWGLRDLDPGEVTYIAGHGPDAIHIAPDLQNYSMEVINQLNAQGKSFESLAQEFSSRLGDHVVISFDVDNLDPTYTPSTGTPVKGGMTLMQSLYVVAKVQDRAQIDGMDVVEVNPLLGEEADREKTLSCAGIVSIFPSLNRTIVDIAASQGVYPAVDALTEFTTQMGTMSFEEGRAYKVSHMVEMASVIVHNLGEKYPEFDQEAQRHAIETITSNLMTRRGEQNNPLFIPSLIGSLSTGMIGLALMTRKRQEA